MIAHDAPKRPALRYYGGKWRLAPWIISYFPYHKNYVEPCCGACSVLLQKPRSCLETINDLDGNVVNFFRVLRDRPDELIRKIRLTPWARVEYELHRVPASDPIEQARRFWVGCSMSVSGSPFTTSGWRHINNVENGPNGRDSWFYVDISHLMATAKRFIGVQVECKPYPEMMQDYDHNETLFYFDPPYLTETRTNDKEYQCEWSGPGPHIEAANLLRQALGYVVISGYACPLYTELYEAHGWTRVDKEAQTNSGGKRIESLWLSPRTWKALQQDMSGLPLFGGVS